MCIRDRVNSPADDISIFIDQESRRGLFTSSRDGGDDDIFLCWLDGLPQGLEETASPSTESEPVIAETTIEPETVKEELTSESTLAETAIEQAEVAEEIIEITDVPVEEVVVDAVEEIKAEATGEAIPPTDPIIPSPEEIKEVPPAEIIEEIKLTTPTTPEITTSESTVVDEIGEKVKQTEIETPSAPELTTLESPAVNEVIEKVEEIETKTPSTPAVTTPESAVVKEVVEQIEETNIELLGAKPINVSNVEEIVETTVDTLSLSEKNKVSQTELIKEVAKEEVIPNTPPQIETTIKESIPPPEKPEKTLEKTNITAPIENTTPESAPSTPSTKDNIKGRSISSTPTRRASFSTLKKDIKKKRPTAGKIYRLKNISYDPGGYLVEKAHGDALDEVFKILKQNQAINIEIASHTYSVGNDQTNLKLSQNRARRAAKYLIDKGISADRIFPVGYGEEQILNRCTNGVACSQLEHAKNERLEIQIIDESH